MSGEGVSKNRRHKKKGYSSTDSGSRNRSRGISAQNKREPQGQDSRNVVRSRGRRTYPQSYFPFSQECGWCGAAFVKAWRVCPVCKTCGSVRAVLNAHNSRYHFYEF
jgi:hypothetical protein